MSDKLWLIWKSPLKRRRYILGELSLDEKEEFTFKYINPELKDAIKEGFDYFPGFDDLEKEYKSKKLFPNIETRLPNPARPDYLEILNSFDLEMNSNSFDILKKTKGRLLTDNFEFVPAFDKNKIEFEIAGTRYYPLKEEIKNRLKINDNLELKMDENNKEDENAIQVIYDSDNEKYTLGFVPRFYSKQLKELLNDRIEYSAKIEKLNLDTPLNDEDITVSVKLIFDTTKK